MINKKTQPNTIASAFPINHAYLTTLNACATTSSCVNTTTSCFLEYVAPKFKAGSVVTYQEDSTYKMGKIKNAILLKDVWNYIITGSNYNVCEHMIKEVIHIDNQQFIKDL